MAVNAAQANHSVMWNGTSGYKGETMSRKFVVAKWHKLSGVTTYPKYNPVPKRAVTSNNSSSNNKKNSRGSWTSAFKRKP